MGDTGKWLSNGYYYYYYEDARPTYHDHDRNSYGHMSYVGYSESEQDFERKRLIAREKDEARFKLEKASKAAAAKAKIDLEIQAKRDATARNSDDYKVGEHQKEIARQLRTAITRAGEGGWKSQYYTGSLTPAMPGVSSRAYQEWREARDSWTVTGDEKFLKELLDAVDFTNPPDASAVSMTASVLEVQRISYRKKLQRNLLVLASVYAIAIFIVLVIL